MEGDSYPPPSEMEVGNVAHESMPVKSMVDYSDSTSADVHHQEHHGGERQDEMDHQVRFLSSKVVSPSFPQYISILERVV